MPESLVLDLPDLAVTMVLGRRLGGSASAKARSRASSGRSGRARPTSRGPSPRGWASPTGASSPVRRSSSSRSTRATAGLSLRRVPAGGRRRVPRPGGGGIPRGRGRLRHRVGRPRAGLATGGDRVGRTRGHGGGEPAGGGSRVTPRRWGRSAIRAAPRRRRPDSRRPPARRPARRRGPSPPCEAEHRLPRRGEGLLDPVPLLVIDVGAVAVDAHARPGRRPVRAGRRPATGRAGRRRGGGT